MTIRGYPFKPKGCPSALAYSPVLPIRVVNPHNSFDLCTWGLVDTGAETCTIPEFIAKKIGHNIKDGRKGSGLTAAGRAGIYEHTFRIEIFKVRADKSVDDKKVVYTIADGFVGVMEGLPFVLLGVNDFLKSHVLTIDYDKCIYSIQKPQKAK